ncbi:MAG: oxidoreductase [Leptospiraceae bacterium]|nr:oxidoreductase [Leptospiraceae bacterium]
MICYVAGATGLVGSQLLQKLSIRSDVETVVALVRKRPEHDVSGNDSRDGSNAEVVNKASYHVVNFDDPDSFPGLTGPVYCCLGTTIKKAGSQEAFRKVDYEYPLNLAKMCAKAGVAFYLVTALGSNASSGIFYNRVKGELEEEVKKLPIPAIRIFRPSLLLGHRKEVRPGEMMGSVAAGLVNPLLLGPLKKYRAIRAEDVARAMALPDQGSGMQILESYEIQARAEEFEDSRRSGS